MPFLKAAAATLTVGLLVAIAQVSKPTKAPAGKAGTYWQPLSNEEAEILANLTPFAMALRHDGFQVTVVRSEIKDQPPFLDFEIIRNPPFPPGGGIEIHQYVDVNLNTGQVWNPASLQQIKSDLLFDIAGIMTRAHHIDGKVMEKYGSLQPQ